MADVTLTVDGKKLTAPAGTLLIEACKTVGIEVPSFCYYPNLSLQGACRMCLVKIEKMPKLQTACTTVITEGMAVTTESDEIRQARKSMVTVAMVERTIPHEVRHEVGAATVLLKPAAPGTGVIAGGSMRAVLELAGIHDILTKCLGTTNPINVVRATVFALKSLRTVEQVAAMRGKTVRDIFAA